MKQKDLSPGMTVAVKLFLGVRKARVLQLNCTYKRDYSARIVRTALPTKQVALALCGHDLCLPKVVGLSQILAPWDTYEAQEQEAEIKRRTDREAAQRAYVERTRNRDDVIARLASAGISAYANGEASIIMNVADAERLLKGKHEA